MNSFRYQASGNGGAPTQGVIEAEDRKTALQLLGQRGLFPSQLELCGGDAAASPTAAPGKQLEFRLGPGIRRKEITTFTREMSALLGAAIPIPQALDSLGEEEENLALRAVVLNLADALRKGSSFSAALQEHSKLFGNLYVSMIRVGEEAGELPKILNDLADLLEHEDEIRMEVAVAVAYPSFVMVFGIVTVGLLLTFVLPRLFGMLQEMAGVLPLPTLLLLNLSAGLHHYWLWLLGGMVLAGGGVYWWLQKPEGAEMWDKIKLRLPVMGPVFQSAALGRFARTLGTLERSGVSLLPALKIVEQTIGNRVLAKQVALVAEETRGGDSLAGPLRKLRLFPSAVIQMIEVGEQTGQLDDMLLKVADIEERQTRAKMKTLISLLAPFLILIVGSVIAFMVISILLPIFKISSAIH